jgi:hypothetical protein
MDIVGLAANAMTAQTQQAVGSISHDIRNVETVLSSLETELQLMGRNVRNGEVQELDDRARRLNIEGGARELQTKLAEEKDFLINKLSTVKESSFRIELEAALQLSRLAAGKICPKELQCPLSLELMEEPVMLVQSGQTYDRKHLQIALAHKQRCDPLTNFTFDDEPRIVINYAVKSLIDNWKQQLASPFDHPPPPPRAGNHRAAAEESDIVSVTHIIITSLHRSGFFFLVVLIL